MRPPTVLVHGVGSSYRHNWLDMGWTDVLEDLGHDVRAFELPGHGAQQPLLDGETVTSRFYSSLSDVPVMDAVGFSAGAMTLLAAACERPDRFRRLALLGVGDAVLERDRAGAEHLAAVLESPDEPSDVVDRVFWKLPVAAGNDRAAVAGYLRGPSTTVEVTALGRVTCPVLIVLGDNDFAGPATRLRAALPHASFVPLTATDHFATTASWSAMDAVTKFLDGD